MIPIVFGSQYVRNKDSVDLHFIPMDTKERWKKNMSIEAHKNYLVEQGWDREDAFIYHVNRYGFRGQWNDHPTALALGCSHTFGIGLPEEDVWCSIVKRELNFELNNLGIPGSGLDGVFRVARYYFETHKPQYAFLLIPPGGRMEILNRSPRPPSHMNIHVHDNEEDIVQFATHWFRNPENAENYEQRNLYAIERLCQLHDVKLYTLDWSELQFPTRRRPRDHRARDMAHFGRPCHQRVAELFIDLFQKDL